MADMYSCLGRLGVPGVLAAGILLGMRLGGTRREDVPWRADAGTVWVRCVSQCWRGFIRKCPQVWIKLANSTAAARFGGLSVGGVGI
jgi:hypothetical protein